MSKILLVEDDSTIILGLKYLFEQEGFLYDIAQEKKEAIKLLNKNEYDLALLDVFLPDGDGFEICKYIKKSYNMFVIFLTARDEENDVVYGFDVGADDYIIKPFRNRELISRINNVLKRSSKQKILSCSNIKIDTVSGRVYKDETEVKLTKLEYTILLNLFSNQNVLITREKLLNDIWDIAGNFVNDNTLTVYIKRIREKIGDNGKIIQTVRGIGYRIGDKNENIR